MSAAIQNAADITATLTAGPSFASRFARKDTGHTIDQAAKDFEGMFMSQMLQPMFETVGVDPIFGGGHGEEAMRGFLIQEYGKAAAQGSHLGIANAVRAEMLRAQQKMNANNQTLNKGVTNVVGSAQ